MKYIFRKAAQCSRGAVRGYKFLQRPLDEWATELLAMGSMLAQKYEKRVNRPKPGVSFRRSFSSPRLAMVGRVIGTGDHDRRGSSPVPKPPAQENETKGLEGLAGRPFLSFLSRREIDRKYLMSARATSQ